VLTARHGLIEKGASTPASLSQAYLQGSMQGKSGAALDLNGDGYQDLAGPHMPGTKVSPEPCLPNMELTKDSRNAPALFWRETATSAGVWFPLMM